MGTLIRLAGANFNNMNLPRIGLAYTGLTSGLLAAHHLNNSLEFSKDLSGNNSELITEGVVSFTDKYARLGDGKNGFISMAADLSGEEGREFTICTIARKVNDNNVYAFPVCSFDGSKGTNIQIRADGIRPQLHQNENGEPGTVFAGDQFTSEQLNFEAGFITCSVNELKTVWYQPRYDWVRIRSLSDEPLHQVNYAGMGSRWLIGFSDYTQNEANDVCYVAIFDRALSEEEIQQQYYSMQQYALALGIGEI